jgi:hypothetical protein
MSVQVAASRKTKTCIILLAHLKRAQMFFFDNSRLVPLDRVLGVILIGGA